MTNSFIRNRVFTDLKDSELSDIDKNSIVDILSKSPLTPDDIENIPSHLKGYISRYIRETFIFDNRNVMDEYKGATTEEIIEDLDKNGNELVVAASNAIHDFNLATVVRNCNAFGVRTLILTGSKKLDRRGAVGADKYMTIDFMEDLEDVISTYRSKGFKIVAIEYDERYLDISHEIEDYRWDEKTVVIFGEEGITLPDRILNKVDDIVYIAMVGSVRSLNVGVTSGIILSDYMHATAKE